MNNVSPEPLCWFRQILALVSKLADLVILFCLAPGVRTESKDPFQLLRSMHFETPLYTLQNHISLLQTISTALAQHDLNVCTRRKANFKLLLLAKLYIDLLTSFAVLRQTIQVRNIHSKMLALTSTSCTLSKFQAITMTIEQRDPHTRQKTGQGLHVSSFF